MKFCPKCNRQIEFDSYFNREVCTSCSWRGKKVLKTNVVVLDNIIKLLESMSNNEIVEATKENEKVGD